jgi:transcriptional regulator with XRE-family HTH domain
MPRRVTPPSAGSSDEPLGRRLAALRKERGLTQTDLAKKLGTAQAVISDYERGKLRPNPEILVRLAKVLDVSADELLGLRPPPKTETARLNRRFLRRLQQIDRLPKRDQDALLRMIDAVLRGHAA